MTAPAHSSRRSGGIVGATWLIGLGVIFLLQQTLDLSWGEAWPMFVILAGIGSLVSLAAGVGLRRRLFAPLAWPLLLVVAGTLLLLSTTGQLGVEPADLVSRWWPLALIAIGAWFLVGSLLASRAGGSERLQLPLGGATEGRVSVGFGGGELSVGSGTSGLLVDAEFEGVPARHKLRGPASVELQPDASGGWPWWDRTPRWRIGLPPGVPLDVEIKSGAARTRLDFSELSLRSLRIGTGASDTRVQLPRAAGSTRVHAEAGAAALTFEVPDGVAVRIRGQMTLGSTRVDESRFPRTGGGWESPGFDSAANRVELEVTGGVGSLDVRGA